MLLMILMAMLMAIMDRQLGVYQQLLNLEASDSTLAPDQDYERTMVYDMIEQRIDFLQQYADFDGLTENFQELVMFISPCWQ